MKSTLQTLAFLPFLATSALAATSSSPLNCQTVLGTRNFAPVPSTTVTVTASSKPTQILVVQSTTTVYTGLTSTSTLLTTETETTTEDTVTDTFSTTTTSYEVQTSTNTNYVTTTSTSTSTTSSTSTTIVPTTAGFRNIADTLNSDQLRRRAAQNPHGMAKRAATSGAQGVQRVLALSTYPQAVSCTSTKVSTVTSYTTLPKVTKTVAYWAKRITEWDTITTTSTVIPNHASYTETDTYTSTVQTTTTVIATNTETTSTTTTNIIPGPTLFDACKPANLFGPNFKHSGAPYYAVNVANNGPGVASDFQILADGASSATDCCYACQKLAICETFIFRARSRNCFLLKHDGNTCSSQFNHPNFILSKKGSDPGDGYTVGNGNCGYTYSGNSDSTVYSVDQ